MQRVRARRLAGLMREEAGRAVESIRSPGHPRPYLVSYLVRDEELWSIEARYGALARDEQRRTRNCYCDVRVGSHRYDQVREGGLDENPKREESYGYIQLPYGAGAPGVRHGLWRLAEARYREAAEEYSSRKSQALTYLDRNRKFGSLQRRTPSEGIHWCDLQQVDRGRWCEYARRASAVPKRYAQIKNSHVRFEARNQVRLYADSDGSLLVECMPFWSLECYLWLLSESGDALPWTIHHLVAEPSELPDLRSFQAEIRRTIALLGELAQAAPLRSYAGPVLLDPVPAGLLIHEALGHRLEGSRMLSSGEGQTFRDSIGQRILPEFLSIHDDPTLTQHEGRSLIGHYHFDDEGTPARDARLVESGVLREFLSGRACTGPRHRSNGHSRNELYERPMSRMSNTVVEAVDGCRDDELKALLIEEVEAQGLPYGIRILAASGGETTTDSYDFQAFLGEINLASRVYPDGREEWVRGVDFVGTPLNATRSIMAAGARTALDNGYCGAESGYVPVSTISPGLLVAHLELQAKADTPYTQYCYPMPWE